MKKPRLLGAVCACIFSFISISSYSAPVVFSLEGHVEFDSNGYMEGRDTITVAATFDDESIEGVDPQYVYFDEYESSNLFSFWLFGTYDFYNWMDPVYSWDVPTRGPFIELENGKFVGLLYSATIEGDLLVNFASSGDSWSAYGDDFEISGYWESDLNLSEVPIPAALWLFGSGLLGLVGMARRKKA